MSKLLFNELGSTPSTPRSGKLAVYAKTDKKVYKKTSDGVETELGAGIATIDGGEVAHPLSPYYQAPPAASTFTTWDNQDSATLTDIASGGFVLKHAQSSNNYITTKVATLSPNNNYKFTFMVIPTTWGQYNRVGIALKYSGENKIVFFGYMQRDDGPFIIVHKYTSSTVFDGVYYEQQMRPAAYAPTWFQLHDDGTYWRWKFSVDGTNFLEIGTTARNDWFSSAANRYGPAVGYECASGLDILGWYRSWKLESV